MATCFGHFRGHPRRVLVVDDDPAMRHMIISYLNGRNCHAIGSDGRDISQRLEAGSFSLVVLEVRLGPLDGLDVLRRIRARSHVPVILTTGGRDDGIDGVLGLELGADDYVSKPINLRELLARAGAILRRQDMGRLVGLSGRGGFRFEGWELRRGTRTLSDPAGKVISLTKNEYALLVAFLEAPRRPLSREYLLRATSMHADNFDRSVDVRVLRLRRKLDAASSGPALIRTERGIGYVLDAAVEVLF